jgi:hypothetical protein
VPCVVVAIGGRGHRFRPADASACPMLASSGVTVKTAVPFAES